MANIAYVRVSTVEQNDERQRESLAAYPIDKWRESVRQRHEQAAASSHAGVCARG